MAMSEDAMHNHLAKCKATVEENIKDWLNEHEKSELVKFETIHTQLLEVQRQLGVLLRVFEQAKGALTFIRWLAMVVAGGWALVVWAKDHLKI